MIGFLFRCASLVALVCAVVTAVMDSIQSVSSSEVLLTSLGTAWAELHAESLGAMRAFWTLHAEAWTGSKPVEWLLAQPTFAVLLVLSLIFWMIGYRRPRRTIRLAA